MPQLGSGTTARIPTNRFFVLRLSIVNSGSNETIAPPLTLIDDTGQRYPELQRWGRRAAMDRLPAPLKAADTLTGNIVFDVPARHYKLEISDEADERKALIDIPLSFTTTRFLAGPGGTQPSLPIPAPVAPK